MIHNYNYNNFNLLRLFASFQVVYIHVLTHLEINDFYLSKLESIIELFPGVPIFFLISGYLITMSYEKNPNLLNYLKNRILRIFPALYMCFLIGLFILYVFSQFNNVSFLEVFFWIFAQLSFFQFYNPDFIRDFGVGVLNGSLWTISVELSFYIILPALYIFLKKNFLKKISLLMCISLLFYYYISEISSNSLIYEKLIEVSILPYLFYFLIGIIFYRFRSNCLKYIENKVLFYFIIYMIICFLKVDLFIFILFKQIVFATLIFSFVFSYRTLSFKLLGNNDFTYGVYIYHMLIVNVMIQNGLVGKSYNLLIVLIISLICGILSYYCVEKPFLNMKKKSLFKQINQNVN